MKRIYLLVFLIVSQIFYQNIKANHYVWLHGYKSNENCWKIYDESFTQNMSTRTKYGFSENIPYISDSLWTAANLNNKSDNILIAHSIGGFIAREMEFAHTNKVKGIITVGTPHDGVYTRKVGNFVNSYEESGITSIYFEFHTKIKDAWQTSATLTISPLLGNLIVNIFLDDPDKKYSKNLPFYVAEGTWSYSKFENNFIKGNKYMTSIGSRKINVPILSFACEEDRWQLARVLFCSKNTETLQKQNVNNDGLYDQQGYNDMKNTSETAKTIAITHTATAATFTALGFVNPFFLIGAASQGVAAGVWYDTESYINNKLDFNHAVYIGAFHTEQRTDCRKILWWNDCKTNTYTIPDPHDGLIPVKSQYIASNQGNNVITPTSSIKNVNHLEEFNHKNTKAEFNKAIVEGGYGNGIFKK
jgi:pimeloyl-ACP methyl ester carboxylesterase